jgi:hypothetical protein
VAAAGAAFEEPGVPALAGPVRWKTAEGIMVPGMCGVVRGCGGAYAAVPS